MKQAPYKLLVLVLLIGLAGISPAWSQGDHQTPSGGGSTNWMFGSLLTTKLQFIYFAGDFSPMPPSGQIDTLWFQRTTSTASTSLQSFDDFEIRLGNTTETTLDGLNFFDEAGLELVYDGPLTIPAGSANSWFFIVLQTPFLYDNSETLILETRLMDPGTPHSTSFSIRWNTVSGTDRRLVSSDNFATVADGSAPRLYNLGLSISTAMPIGLRSFSARKTSDYVDISWATDFEQNNEYFTIERSGNGRDWQSIHTLASNGNSSTVQQYSIIDADPLNGRSFYRLKQNDFDGQFSYSPVESVFFEGNIKEKLHVFPNPFNDLVHIAGLNSAEEEVQILNTLGQDLTNLAAYSYDADARLMLDMSRFEAGMYYLRTDQSMVIVFKR